MSVWVTGYKRLINELKCKDAMKFTHSDNGVTQRRARKRRWQRKEQKEGKREGQGKRKKGEQSLSEVM